MKRLMTICLVCVCVAMAQIAVAEDIQPPWWRGQVSTTHQYWEFNTEVQPGEIIRPDGPGPLKEGPPYEVGYLPSTQLVWTPGTSSPPEWMPSDQPTQYEYQGHSGVVGYGVVPLSGNIEVIVDNHWQENPYKQMWVQITWRPQVAGAVPDVVAGMGDPGHTTTPPTLRDPPGVVPLGTTGWFESTYIWRIYPNPIEERFWISGMINVDELVIDTWCVPEPTTMILLGLGGVVSLVSRKHRA